jgi:hypothetical protein
MPMSILTERTPARHSFLQHLPQTRVVQLGPLVNLPNLPIGLQYL